MKSEMQLFAAPLPDETFPVRDATRKSWKPRPELAASHPLQATSQLNFWDRSSQGCQYEEFVPVGS